MVSHSNLCYSALQPAYMLAEFSKVSPVSSSLVPFLTRCVLIFSLLQPSPPNTPEGVHIGLCVLPMYHSASLHGFILRALLSPQTAVILPKYNLNLLVDAISRSVLPLLYVPASARCIRRRYLHRPILLHAGIGCRTSSWSLRLSINC